MTGFLIAKLSGILEQLENPWVIIGFLGQVIFAGRFIVQWIASEKRKESVIPVSFWYMSIVGSLITLIYTFHKEDPVFILAYLFNSLIYVRNLTFIHKTKKDYIEPGSAIAMIRGEHRKFKNAG